MQKMTPLRIAALILGAVMGSGFVSGREIYQFFTRFGIWGGVGLVCSLIALCALGCVVMQEAGESSCGDPVCALFPDGSPRALRRLGRVILTAALFVMYTGMLAAGGAAFQMEFGLPAWSGALAVAAVSVWWSAGGLQALQRSVGRATPLLTAGLLVAAAYCGFRSPCPPWNSPPPTPGDGGTTATVPVLQFRGGAARPGCGGRVRDIPAGPAARRAAGSRRAVRVRAVYSPDAVGISAAGGRRHPAAAHRGLAQRGPARALFLHVAGRRFLRRSERAFRIERRAVWTDRNATTLVALRRLRICGEPDRF